MKPPARDAESMDGAAFKALIRAAIAHDGATRKLVKKANS